MLKVELYGGPSDGLVFAIPASEYPDEVFMMQANLSKEQIFQEDFDPSEVIATKKIIYTHTYGPRYRYSHCEENKDG